MALLAKGKRLRGSWADLFGRTAERMSERRLRDEYLDPIEPLSSRVDAATLPLATAIVAVSGLIRCFGPVMQIGRASSQVRVCQNEYLCVVAGKLPKKS